MATFTASVCQTNSSGFFLSPPKYNEKGVQARSATFTWPASQSAPSAGDVVQMVNVPKAAEILDVQLDVVTAAQVSWALSVGDGNSTNRYIASGSNGTANVIRLTQATGAGYSYSAEDTIDVVVGALGSASGTFAIRLTAFYVFDQASDGGS